MNKNKNNTDKHTFALYWSSLSKTTDITKEPITVTLDDQELVHRIVQVLRLTHGDTIILFDESFHTVAHIRSIEKKQLLLDCMPLQKNKQLHPHITVLLPLLKREALERALYSLTVLGVDTVQLVLTQKVQRAWLAKEYERLQKIIIAAAEQAKQYTLLELHAPLSLEKAIANHRTDGLRLFADPAGQLVMALYEQHVNAPSLTLMIGPEGDLTEQEKNYLHEHEFTFCALTSTVLPAAQAIELFAGLWRIVR